MNDIAAYRKIFDQKEGQRILVQKTIKEKQKELRKVTAKLDHAEEARAIIYSVAQKTQETLVLNIETIVTTAIKSVFGEGGYEFKVDFNIKRNRTEADMYFTKNGFRYNPMSGSGYGVVDVASFALRIVALELSSPNVRKLLIIDEPFKNLSDEFHDLAGQMIREISENLDIQFIIVTHVKGIADNAHKVFNVHRTGKFSNVKEA